MKKRTHKTKSRRKPSNSYQSAAKGDALTSPSGMGGIIGGEGYDFQTRYIVCHIPKWITEAGFTQLFHEGTGDVDIHYGNAKRERREHIQIKDHQVKTREFKEAIEKFIAIEKGMAGIYDRFTLACPALDQKVRPLETALKRFRDAKPFYDGKPDALDQTENEVRKRIKNLGLIQNGDFVLSKVYFEVGLRDFHNDASSCDIFIASLLKLPSYKDKLFDLVNPAYSVLFREVGKSRGKILHRTEIEGLIESSLKSNKESGESAINLVIHNWTYEKFEREPDYLLDWCSYFDRSVRRVPDQRLWNEELIPQLHELRKKIAPTTSKRLIRFRGKCCLSTGIVLGTAFPKIGGWIFEVTQPPLPLPWRSDVVPEINYRLRVEEENPASAKLDSNGDSIAILFNITGSAFADVAKHIKDNSLPVKKIILVQPASSSGSLSIANDREAVSLAMAARDSLKQVLAKYGANSTHLFFHGPLALAIFLGQMLTSIGQIQLYEFKDPGYVPSCTLRT